MLSFTQNHNNKSSITADLNIERLEQRDVPAVIFNASSGFLGVYGTNSSDVLEVRYEHQGTSSPYDDKVIVEINNSVEAIYDRYKLELVGPRSVQWTPNVKHISMYGYNGIDRLFNNTAIPSYQNGGDGTDGLYGGSGNDTLIGDWGNDYLFGGNGNDQLIGGAGNDWMEGGSGNDYLTDRQLVGEFPVEGGNDTLVGGDGQDTLFGYSGNDRLLGGIDGYVDYLYGGSGNDSFETEWYFSGGWFKNRNVVMDYASGDSFF
ncbi:MAG: calcium-binding protein [Gemmataceae bacterium]